MPLSPNRRVNSDSSAAASANLSPGAMPCITNHQFRVRCARSTMWWAAFPACSFPSSDFGFGERFSPARIFTLRSPFECSSRRAVRCRRRGTLHSTLYCEYSPPRRSSACGARAISTSTRASQQEICRHISARRTTSGNGNCTIKRMRRRNAWSSASFKLVVKIARPRTTPSVVTTAHFNVGVAVVTVFHFAAFAEQCIGFVEQKNRTAIFGSIKDSPQILLASFNRFAE